MGWATYCGLWLRVAGIVHHAGESVLLAGSGIGFPENVAKRPETRYFDGIKRCALVCGENEMEKRLDGKAWLEGRPERRAEFLESNRWFRTEGSEHGIELVDTTDVAVAESAAAVAEWLAEP